MCTFAGLILCGHIRMEMMGRWLWSWRSHSSFPFWDKMGMCNDGGGLTFARAINQPCLQEQVSPGQQVVTDEILVGSHCHPIADRGNTAHPEPAAGQATPADLRTWRGA